MGKNKPRVSVVMPVYNAEAYLAEAIDSILEQSFEDFEFIAIDDGSTDGSADILNRYAEKDPRISILRQPNSGIVMALNAGLAVAKGRYIARMDADDISAPERFALQVAFLDAHPDVVALGTQIRLIDPDGRVLLHLPLPCDHAGIDAQLMEGVTTIVHPTAMIRANAVNTAGGYSEDYPQAQDIDLWLRLAEIGELSNLPEILLAYRLHFSSVGLSKRQNQIDYAYQAVREAVGRRGLDQVPARPSGTAATSCADIFRRWGWWALMGGNVGTARLYAGKSLKAAPFSPANWKLALFALRGR